MIGPQLRDLFGNWAVGEGGEFFVSVKACCYFLENGSGIIVSVGMGCGALNVGNTAPREEGAVLWPQVSAQAGRGASRRQRTDVRKQKSIYRVCSKTKTCGHTGTLCHRCRHSLPLPQPPAILHPCPPASDF